MEGGLLKKVKPCIVDDIGTLSTLDEEHALVLAKPSDAPSPLEVKQGWPLVNGLYGGVGNFGLQGQFLLAPGIVCAKAIEFDLHFVTLVLRKVLPEDGYYTLAPAPIIKASDKKLFINSEFPFLLVSLEDSTTVMLDDFEHVSLVQGASLLCVCKTRFIIQAGSVKVVMLEQPTASLKDLEVAWRKAMTTGVIDRNVIPMCALLMGGEYDPCLSSDVIRALWKGDLLKKDKLRQVIFGTPTHVPIEKGERISWDDGLAKLRELEAQAKKLPKPLFHSCVEPKLRNCMDRRDREDKRNFSIPLKALESSVKGCTNIAQDWRYLEKRFNFAKERFENIPYAKTTKTARELLERRLKTFPPKDESALNVKDLMEFISELEKEITKFAKKVLKKKRVNRKRKANDVFNEVLLSELEQFSDLELELRLDALKKLVKDNNPIMDKAVISKAASALQKEFEGYNLEGQEFLRRINELSTRYRATGQLVDYISECLHVLAQYMESGNVYWLTKEVEKLEREKFLSDIRHFGLVPKLKPLCESLADFQNATDIHKELIERIPRLTLKGIALKKCLNCLSNHYPQFRVRNEKIDSCFATAFQQSEFNIVVLQIAIEECDLKFSNTRLSYICNREDAQSCFTRVQRMTIRFSKAHKVPQNVMNEFESLKDRLSHQQDFDMSFFQCWSTFVGSFYRSMDLMFKATETRAIHWKK
jgi:hypothetical protein